MYKKYDSDCFETREGVFEQRTSTGNEDVSLVICIDAIKFVLSSFFTLVEAI